MSLGQVVRNFGRMEKRLRPRRAFAWDRTEVSRQQWLGIASPQIEHFYPRPESCVMKRLGGLAVGDFHFVRAFEVYAAPPGEEIMALALGYFIRAVIVSRLAW